MLIKFLNHGTGSAERAAAYLTGTHDHTGTERADVRVLRGDPKLIAHLADGLPFVQRYTSGVIAWHRDDKPTQEEIEQVLEDFERTAFAGLDRSQYTYSAILHQEADGSKHVHLFMPRIELLSGRSLNIAPPGWTTLFGHWRDAWNFERGWARPDDPARARAIRPGPVWQAKERSRRSELRAQAMRLDGLDEGEIAEALALEVDPRQALEQLSLRLVMEGHVADRQGLVQALKRFAVVAREGDDYISVKPTAASKAIRLRGAIFQRSADYLAIRAANADRSRRAEDDEARVLDRLASVDEQQALEARRRLAQCISRRARYHARRYPLATAQREAEAVQLITHEAEVANRLPALEAQTHARTHHAGVSDGPRPELSRSLREQIANAPTGNRTEKSYDRGRDASETGARAAEAGTPRDDGATGSPVPTAPWVDSTEGRSAIGLLGRAASRLAEATRRFVEAAGKFMRNRVDELEMFKRDVNIVEYAQELGFEVDRRKSCRSSVLLSRGAEKIVCATDERDGHGIWFEIGGSESGSIIDFVQHVRGCNLGEVRKELRSWLGSPTSPAPHRSAVEKRSRKPEPISYDQARLTAQWHAFGSYSGEYLRTRGLEREMVAMADVRQDDRGNACLAHRDRNGEICGWEIKNQGFTGFSRGGSRGLGLIRFDEEPIEQVVLVESFIDAVSWAQINDRPRATAYISLGGAIGKGQIEMLKDMLIREGPRQLIIGTDNDSAGDEIAAEIRKHVRPICSSMRDTPPPPVKDWNDLLQQANQEQVERRRPGLGFPRFHMTR
jgi:5S rRNA maturation endonuclease (ribonuclease M5)